MEKAPPRRRSTTWPGASNAASASWAAVPASSIRSSTACPSASVPPPGWSATGSAWASSPPPKTRVCKHLDEHLAQVPRRIKSRAILEQMRIDEEQHSSQRPGCRRPALPGTGEAGHEPAGEGDDQEHLPASESHAKSPLEAGFFSSSCDQRCMLPRVEDLQHFVLEPFRDLLTLFRRERPGSVAEQVVLQFEVLETASWCGTGSPGTRSRRSSGRPRACRRRDSSGSS